MQCPSPYGLIDEMMRMMGGGGGGGGGASHHKVIPDGDVGIEPNSLEGFICDLQVFSGAPSPQQ